MIRLSRFASVVAAAAALMPATASAQALFWDWGGEQEVDGSGRELVKMAVAQKPGDIIVSFGDRKLYFVTKPGEALSYPVAIPREQSRWQGKTSVTMKRENPSWTPTANMRKENPKLPSWVPGGHPMNPLGNRALYLGTSEYRIHGTDAPWTIGSAVSKGCVRLYNKDVADLYPRVKTGAAVLVTWDKFKTQPADSETVPPVASAEGTAKPTAKKARGSETSALVQKADDEAQIAAEAKPDADAAQPRKPGRSIETGSLRPKQQPSETGPAAPAERAERTPEAKAAKPSAKPAAKPVAPPREELEI